MTCTRGVGLALGVGLAVLLAGSLGCSRSALSGGRRAGAGGASSSSSSAGPGGGGPGGAGPIACNGLDQLATRSFDNPFGLIGHVPHLVASSADGEQVSLLVRAESDPIPTDGNSELTQVTFFPWQQWSGQSLGTALDVAAATGFSAPRQADDGISFVGSYSTFATGQGTQYALELPTTATFVTPTVIAPQPNRTSFMTARAGSVHGYGYIDNSTGVQEAHIGMADDNGAQDLIYTCMNAGMRMDGVAVQDSILAAITLPAFEPCGGISAIQLVRYQTISSLSVVHTEPVSSLMQMQLIPRNGGAWLLWQENDGETSGPLVARPLNDTGAPTGEVVTLFGSGVIFERVAATEFGDGGLAIAYADALDPSTPTIIVQLFDPNGAALASASFTPTAWPSVAEPFSLISSPAGDSLVLAWSALMADNSIEGSARSYLTRLDCATDL